MNKIETSTISFYKMELEEIKTLEIGDEIAICLKLNPPEKVEFIGAKVTRPLFWNSDADEPGWELETNNGFVDPDSVWGFKADKLLDGKSEPPVTMAKVKLTTSEVGQIVVDYLVSKGKLENKTTDIFWNVDMWKPENSVIVLSQETSFTIRPGKSYIFETTETTLKEYNGTKVEVIRPLTEEECDVADVGNMFKVRFNDGNERDVFEDELVKEA